MKKQRKKRVSLYLSSGTLERMKIEAKKSYRSLSEHVNMALDKNIELKKERTAK